MKKDELIAENASLSHRLELSRVEDLELREEFAKAFNWYTVDRRPFSDHEKKLKQPSWQEIFVEVGKLLANQTRLEIKEELEYLRRSSTESEERWLRIQDEVVALKNSID